MILGHVTTDLGRIELHHDGEQFDTRRTFIDAICGVVREPIIWHSRGNAREWYDLMEERGAVFAEFPEEVAA